MNLTVVVPTIPERNQLLGRCLWYLEHQTVPVEVIVAISGRGKGVKLNRAFARAESSHVMVCDDDDWLSETAVEQLLAYDEDWVGYDSAQLVDGRFDRVVHHDVGSHICPVKTEIARSVPFGNEYAGAYGYQATVASQVKSTGYVDEVLYYYDKWNGPTEWSPTRQVGVWPHNKLAHRWL